ncbi:tubulin polyglutamylase TTLL6-like [Daktulosphaira vitifoliae]|uniref:tubulin polyglutamylase TTLL6-like n=1 Tax=Daktulosphaira vitifoliae TaxID=58002 RepID=UPI0021AA7B5A|nr:tubulin polyglutamylase TTLL6-like [Daktulosphaira vitifoliae]
MLKKIKKNSTICLQTCKYDIVNFVAKSLGMKEMDHNKPWDICWTDSLISVEKVKDMKKYQKINHFPGVVEICRKDLLASNLNRMIFVFPNEYDFFPKTWYLPIEYTKLKNYMSEHKGLTYILKPDVGSKGEGIYLTKSLKKFDRYEKSICQVYISKPLLMDGYKFDIRVYTLIASCDPLRIYVYNDGLVRLATEQYEKPSVSNLKNRFMHLTNYSVNKRSTIFVDNEHYGSKRRIKTLNEWLEAKGYNVGKIWNNIDDIIIKTIIIAYPFVKRSYEACFPKHEYTSACFELLGFDILIDVNCKPYLLEVNHSPSYHTETTLDKILKQELLTDTFKLLQLDTSIKKLVIEEEKWKAEQRKIIGDKTAYNQRILECKKMCEENKRSWEMKNMGNYRLIYPEKDSNLYEKFFYQNESTLYKNTHSSKLRLKPSINQKIDKSIRKYSKYSCKQKNTENNLKSEIFSSFNSNKFISKNEDRFNEKTTNFSSVLKRSKNNIKSISSLIIYNKRKGYWNCWDDFNINVVDENERLISIKNRDKIMFNFGIKEHIYNAFKKYNLLTENDEVNYANYKKKKTLLEPNSRTYFF